MSEAIQSTSEAAKTRFRNPLNPPIRYLARRFGGSNPKELERFLRFAVVGVTGAIIDLGMLTVLQSTLLPPALAYDNSLMEMTALAFPIEFAIALPLNVALATTIAFLAAVLSNFIWTTLWVYPESRDDMRKQLIQFALISVVGWSARTLWITTMYTPIGNLLAPRLEPLIQLVRPTFEATVVATKQIGTIIAQLIAMWFVMLWNFFANRYWTFGDVD